jgi:anaerobic selenocysteine-containing dehydrogenase
VGSERLYADGVFPTQTSQCETFGRDLVTGAAVERPEYEALDPAGRAVIRPAEYVPPREWPDVEHPLQLVTGRTLYHFHTRTKTARAPQLQAAAPEVWIELSPADATAAGLDEGDVAEIETARGRVRARVRVGGVRDGVAFVPFHYGYWDRDGDDHERAANELTPTAWDAVSKQPIFKTAAARVTFVERGDGRPAPAPTTTASAPARGGVAATTGGPAAESDEDLEVAR